MRADKQVFATANAQGDHQRMQSVMVMNDETKRRGRDIDHERNHRINRFFNRIKSKLRNVDHDKIKNKAGKGVESSNSKADEQGKDNNMRTQMVPGAVGIKTWTESLDNLLSDSYGRHLFLTFLQTEYCDEVLEFWQACEQYKTISNDRKLAFATEIFVTYIKTGSERQDLKDIVQHLCSSNKCSVVRTALVRFRDHPPQDNTFVTQVFDFSDNVAVVQAHLDNSQADGGGDGPEAISDAMNDGVHNLSWNSDSKKVIVLCTDARPHGVAHACGEYDSFSRGCPSGHDPVALAHEMARRSITLLSLCTATADTRFMAGISLITGGRLVYYTQAIDNFGELMVGLILEDFDIEAMMAQIQNELAAEAERMGTSIDERELTRRMAGITSGKLERYEFPNEETYGTHVAQAEDIEAYLRFRTLDEACDYISQNYKSFRPTHEPASRKRLRTVKRKRKDTKGKKRAIAKPLVVKVTKNPMKPKVLGVRKSLRLALRDASQSARETVEDSNPPQLDLIREQGEELNQEIRRLVRKAIARKEQSKK